MKKLKKLTMTLVALFAMTTGAWADTTVTFTASDLADGSSITKDGVTLTSYGQNGINQNGVNGPGEFTNSLGGNFTKIVVTADGLPSGDGWSTGTWTGSASSVSFTGDIEYYGEVSIVCTLETPPAEPGAVAQSYEAKVFDVPASWAGDNTPLSAADLPEDFVQITDDEAAALAFPDGNGYLIYGFNGEKVKVLIFNSGTLAGGFQEEATRGDIIGGQSEGGKICYPAAPGTALTPDATRKVWTLAAMPVNDVELQVEYYPAMLSLGGDAIEGGTVEVLGLTGDALPAGFEKDAEGNIYVAEGTTFTVKATPDEGYHLVCWGDDENNTHPEREITMGVQDLAFTATFAENEYDITFSEGENPEWTATPNPAKFKQTVTVTYSGTKKVIGVKAGGPPALNLTSPAVGQVIGSDGLNYADAAAATSAGVTAVARICYVSGEHGLALALADKTGKMNWSTAISTCAAHTPKFTNGTWLLASKDQWDCMLGTDGAGSLTALRDGFSSVGGSDMQQDYYWTSTQAETDPSAAWRYNCQYGFWNRDIKTNATTRVRACLAW